MTIGSEVDLTYFGERIAGITTSPGIMQRYFIGGSLGGTLRDIDNPNVYTHRSYDPPLTTAYSLRYLPSEHTVSLEQYTPRRFGHGEKLYIVMVLVTMSEEHALYEFDMNRSKIRVASYLTPVYPTGLGELRRRYFMEHMISVGPSGKIGKHPKKAVLMICYGAGVKQTVSESGLSRRRVKVMMKKIKSYGGMLREHRY